MPCYMSLYLAAKMLCYRLCYMILLHDICYRTFSLLHGLLQHMCSYSVHVSDAATVHVGDAAIVHVCDGDAAIVHVSGGYRADGQCCVT